MSTEVDTKLLSAEEIAEYRRLASGGLRASELLRHLGPLWLVTALWAVAVVGCAVLVAQTDAAAPEPNPADDGPMAMLVIVLLGGAAAVIAFTVRISKRTFARLSSEYLSEVGYTERVKDRDDRAKKRRVYDDDDRALSRREMQHRWYGDGNSDLNWRDRELGEALGIPDGDTYKANWQ